MRYLLPLLTTILLFFALPNAAQGQERDEDKERGERTERRAEDRGNRRGRGAERRSRNDRSDRRQRSERRRDEQRQDDDRATRQGGEWERSERESGDWEDDPYNEEGSWENEERRAERGRRGGPPFCRNGEGHPVHGRQWCIEKGFGLGGGDDGRWGDDGRYGDGRYGDGQYGDAGYGDRRYDNSRWRRVDARGITFRTGLLDQFRGELDEEDLRRVLGSEIVYRLRDHQRDLRLSGPLRGSFEGGGLLSGDQERTLRVFAREGAVAHLIDVDGDDRVERVYLRRRYAR